MPPNKKSSGQGRKISTPANSDTCAARKEVRRSPSLFSFFFVFFAAQRRILTFWTHIFRADQVRLFLRSGLAGRQKGHDPFKNTSIAIIFLQAAFSVPAKKMLACGAPSARPKKALACGAPSARRTYKIGKHRKKGTKNLRS